MALARVQAADRQWCYQLIETYFESKKLRVVKFYRLLIEKEVLSLLPHVKDLKPYLISSRTVHAVELKDGTILVHPDPVYKIFRQALKANIRHLAVK